MSGGRLRTEIGTYGEISARKNRRSYTAKTWFRDLDGVLRPVEASARGDKAARAALKVKLLKRKGYGGGVLDPSSSFGALDKLWRADPELRKINEGTKHNYLEDLRLHVRPAFEHYTLGEMTTGRVEHFLQREAAVSYSRAKHSRTMLNLLFNFALRHDAIPRNPVEGTSPLVRDGGDAQGEGCVPAAEHQDPHFGAQDPGSAVRSTGAAGAAGRDGTGDLELVSERPVREFARADQGAGKVHESEVEVGADLVAGA